MTKDELYYELLPYISVYQDAGDYDNPSYYEAELTDAGYDYLIKNYGQYITDFIASDWDEALMFEVFEEKRNEI